MFDFFDEDFPLSKKQEEEYKKRLEAEKAEQEQNSEPDSAAPEAETPVPPAVVSDDIVIEPITGIETVYPDDDDDGYDGEPEDSKPAEPAHEPEPEPEPIPEPESTETEPEPMPELELTPEPEAESAPMPEVETTPESEAEPEPEPAPESVPEEPNPATETVPEKQEETADVNDGEQPSAESDTAPEVGDIGRRIASLDEIEAHLHEELRSLGEKLDSMEKVVDGMDDAEIADGFDYEYDERYFAEEETPAYRHPELYGKSGQTVKNPPVAVKKKQSKDITVNTGTLIKAGAMIAAAALAVSLLGKRDKKK